MVVSTAIGEFAEILADLERTEKKVRTVSLTGTDGDAETVTGRVEVGLPVVDDVDVTDGVTIDATDAELTDGYVDVTLEFSLPVRDSGTDRPSELDVETANAFIESKNGTPPYKDPDALQAVYEEYDTFPAMTSALGVDVTSETVRRYMVEYGIHDPDDSESESKHRTDTADRDATESDATDPSTDESRNAPTDSDAGAEENGDPDFADRSVAEILANTDLDENDSLIADGIGISRNLTVGDLADVLDQSRTVSEVNRALDLEREQTRRVLKELGVIEFVTGRLTSQRNDVTLDEVKRRIRGAGLRVE